MRTKTGGLIRWRAKYKQQITDAKDRLPAKRLAGPVLIGRPGAG